MDEGDGRPHAFSSDARRLSRSMSSRGSDQADAANPALRGGRLQLYASGHLRRGRLSDPANVRAEPQHRGLSWRGGRIYGTAAPGAVAMRGPHTRAKRGDPFYAAPPPASVDARPPPRSP